MMNDKQGRVRSSSSYTWDGPLAFTSLRVYDNLTLCIVTFLLPIPVSCRVGQLHKSSFYLSHASSSPCCYGEAVTGHFPCGLVYSPSYRNSVCPAIVKTATTMVWCRDCSGVLGPSWDIAKSIQRAICTHWLPFPFSQILSHRARGNMKYVEAVSDLIQMPTPLRDCPFASALPALSILGLSGLLPLYQKHFVDSLRSVTATTFFACLIRLRNVYSQCFPLSASQIPCPRLGILPSYGNSKICENYLLFCARFPFSPPRFCARTSRVINGSQSRCRKTVLLLCTI